MPCDACCPNYQPKPQPVTLKQAMEALQDWWEWGHSQGDTKGIGVLHGRRDALLARYDATKGQCDE